MTDVHENGLFAGLSGLCKSGRYSDITVVCGTREFLVHKAVICPRSKFFATACDGSFQESITKKIVLEDDDPDTVGRMLLYLYTCDYNDRTFEVEEASTCSKESETKGEADRESENDSNQTTQAAPGIDSAENISTKDPKEQTAVEVSGGESNTEESALLNNAMVYIIAEKYDISELKRLAKTKFLNKINTLLSSHEFPEVIKTIYKFTPPKDRDFREIVSQECAMQVRKLMKDQAFKDIISEVGDFGIDILDEALKLDDEHLARVKDQNANLRAKVEGLEWELKHAYIAMKSMIRNVNNTGSCGRCHAEFSGHIDADTPSVLQCAKCQFRQMCF